MRNLLVMLLLVAGCTKMPACYRPVSHERGWKRVILPKKAPHLLAISDVDQFRGGEAALIWGDWRHDYDTFPSMGSMRYTFHLPPGTERITVRFSNYLGGAGVEVEGWREWDSYRIQGRTRTSSDELDLEVGPGTERVTVIVHHHLRAAPGIYGWRVGWRGRVSADGFDATASLYYYDPGDQRVELCESPDKTPGVHLARIDAPPTTVAVRPTLLTRLMN